jgi:hypothetical protein
MSADGWFAISDGQEGWNAPASSGIDRAEALEQGSLVIETRSPQVKRPRPLVRLVNGGGAQVDLTLTAVSGGGLSFVLTVDGDVTHHTFPTAEAGRSDVLRLTYSWDAAARQSRVALETGGQERTEVVTFPHARALPVAAISALTGSAGDCYRAPDLTFIAASREIEPVGPQPGLALSTPIATCSGYRPIAALKRGDLVRSGTGDLVPVLYVIERKVPALGSFAPLRIRAPFFRLQRDICVSPMQKIVLSGSEVEYLFGRETVGIRASHLTGGPAVRRMKPVRFVTYRQLILPDHETLDAMGAEVESLFLGRIRRKPEQMAASLVAGLDRASLPEHAPPCSPVLSAFDAVVLAEHRAA